MNSINNSFFRFIDEHAGDNPSELMLKYKGNPDVRNFDLTDAVLQIESRKKYRKKLSPFISNREFLFPDSISGEQCTDYRVALYHSEIFGNGNKILDMTAGLGIDAMTLALSSNHVTAFEQSENKCNVLRHNVSTLGIEHLDVICGDSTYFINESKKSFDIIFIDPARRSNDHKRTYSFNDCQPDILPIFDQLLDKSKRVIVKASPLLDITQVIRQLPHVTEVHAVSVKGECKEILIISERRNNNGYIKKTAVDLDVNGKYSIFDVTDTPNNDCRILRDLNNFCYRYLYEPNASVMKFNCGASLCSAFEGLVKLGHNTQLYVSDTFYENFPGRKMRIFELMEKKDLKKLTGEHLNVVARNYKIKAAELQKRYGILSGKEKFLYACRAGIKETALLMKCQKI